MKTPIFPAPETMANVPLRLYTFTLQTPVPPILAVTGDAAHELKKRIPLAERDLLSINAPDQLSPYSSAVFLALQFLRTMPHHRDENTFMMAVSEITLVSTLLSICGCDDAIWQPQPDWTHAKATMLQSIMGNMSEATLRSLRELSDALGQPPTARPHPVIPTRGIH